VGRSTQPLSHLWGQLYTLDNCEPWDNYADMARPLRVEFAGAAYHVMARGNERKDIFRDDEDRRRFLDTLAEMVERFRVRLQAYCLMPNHYHLLFNTPQPNLSQAVGWLQVTYTVRFNHRHRRSGHLFQGRFRAQIIDADEYAQGLIEYVHLNPIRPRRKNERLRRERARELNGYRWSSHRAYAGLTKSPPWLQGDWLRYWGTAPRAAHRQYRRSLARWFDRPPHNPWESLVDGLALGGDQLLAKVRAQLARHPAAEEKSWLQRQEQPQLQRALRTILDGEPDERVRIWARVRLGGERGIALAREYGYRTGSGVGQLIRRLEQRSLRDRALRKKLESVTRTLSRVESWPR